MNKILTQKRWSFLLFYGIHFLIIVIIWFGRTAPPEVDDSYAYIAKIRMLAEYGYPFSPEVKAISPHSPDRIIYLPWVASLAFISKISTLSPSIVYYLNFYIGILIAAPILWKSIALLSNPRIANLAVIILAFYSGEGTYHGFYWIVPSFYTTILFFLLCALISKPRLKFLLIALSINSFYVILHPTAIISYVAISIFSLCLAIYQKNSKLCIHALIIILSAILFYSSWQTYFSSKQITNRYTGMGRVIQDAIVVPSRLVTVKESIKSVASPRQAFVSPQTVISRIYPILKKTIQKHFPSLPLIRDSYILLVITTAPLVFFLTLTFIAWKKNLPLTLLFGSTLILTVVSIINPWGVRSLTFLWPITLVLAASGIYHAVKHPPMPIWYRLLEIATLLDLIGIILLPSTGLKQQMLKIIHSIFVIILCSILITNRTKTKLSFKYISVIFAVYLLILLTTTSAAQSIFLNRSQEFTLDKQAVSAVNSQANQDQKILYHDKRIYYLFLAQGGLFERQTLGIDFPNYLKTTSLKNHLVIDYAQENESAKEWIAKINSLINQQGLTRLAIIYQDNQIVIYRVE